MACKVALDLLSRVVREWVARGASPKCSVVLGLVSLAVDCVDEEYPDGRWGLAFVPWGCLSAEGGGVGLAFGGVRCCSQFRNLSTVAVDPGVDDEGSPEHLGRCYAVDVGANPVFVSGDVVGVGG